MRVGDRVTLVCPENPKLHGKPAFVAELKPWGALCHCPAAATGFYRAAFGEMLPAGVNGRVPAAVPSGDLCANCGSPNMVRTGSCLTCTECGSSSGGCG